MARLLRGHLTARSQQEGAGELERDPQQEEQPDAAMIQKKTMRVQNPKMSQLLKTKVTSILMQNIQKRN